MVYNRMMNIVTIFVVLAAALVFATWAVFRNSVELPLILFTAYAVATICFLVPGAIVGLVAMISHMFRN